MAAAAARTRAAYRQLLRAVDKHVTAVRGNNLWRDAVRDGFRAGAAAGAETEDALRRAEDLAFYVNSVNEHKARARAQRSSRDRAAWPADLPLVAARLRALLPLTPRRCCARAEPAAILRHKRGQGRGDARPREAHGGARGAAGARRRLFV